MGIRAASHAVGPALLAPVLLSLGAAQAVSQESTTLRGELLLRDGQAATGVRLVVVGHPPEVVVRDGGLFAHPLTGDPSEVTVRVVGDPALEVLYPPDGRTAVPREPGTPVAIVVGRRIGLAVEDRIDRDLRALRETLEVRGVSEADIQAVLRTEMDGLVDRIAEITEGAVGRAVAGADRVALRDRLSRHLRNYLRTARDLLRAFELIEVSEEMSSGSFQALYNAVGAYNDAFTELNESLGEAPAEVRRAWPGEEGRARGDEVARILGLIHQDFHPEVRDLSAPLLVLQARFNGGDPDDDDLRGARQTVADALARLDPPLSRLESDVPPLLESLRTP